MNALQQVRCRDISEVEWGILPHEDHVERGKVDALAFSQGEMITDGVAHRERLHAGEHMSVA